MKYFITILITLPLLVFGQKEEPTISQEAKMKAEMALIDGEKHVILENYAKALEMFMTARDINPKDAAIHYKIAEVLYRNKEYNKALLAIERALELEDGNKFYYVLAADIETARSDLAAAQKHYEKLIRLPDTEDYLGDLALLYEYQGKHKKALETFEKVQDHFGTNELLVLEKQKIFMQMGEPELVLDEWKRLIKENPGENDFIFSLVGELVKFGKVEEARTALEEILSKDENNARAGLMMAEIMKNSGKQEDALKYARASLLSKQVDFNYKGGILNDLLKSNTQESAADLGQLVMDVAAIHPDEYTAQAFAGDVLFQIGNKREAINYYLKATSINPDNFTVWQNILSLESEFGLWEDLIKHADEAIELFPNQGAFYYFGGTAYLRTNKYQRASSLLEIGKRYAINDELKSAFNGQLGDAYNGMKSYAKSDQAYEDALKSNPENEHVLNNYSYYLSLRKANLERALELSTALIKLNPNSPTYLDTHGWVLFTSGQFKEARKHLEKAATNGASATVVEHYGDVLFKLGETGAALAQWEKAATMSEPSEVLLKKIAEKKYYE